MLRKPCFALAILLLFAGLLTSGLACRRSAKKIITSSDERFQITVPGGWVKETSLHKDAELQASHRGTNMYMIILAENKADLADMNLQKHSEITRKGLEESLKDPKESEPVSLVIDGKPAVQYEIRGVKDNLNIIYLHTTVESPTHFYQILAWTIPSTYQKDPNTLKKITGYFHEIKTEGTSS